MQRGTLGTVGRFCALRLTNPFIVPIAVGNAHTLATIAPRKFIPEVFLELDAYG